MTNRLLSTAAATVFAVIGSLSPAFAAPTTNSPTAGQALEISPPVVDLAANPGQSITTLIRIRNVAQTDLIVTGEVNDFVAAGEDGTPKLLLDSTEPNPYSVRGWITTVPKLRLVPREVQAMSITINVPANASPGGHYGVIRFSAVPPNLDGTGVSLSASLGTLTLIRVNGAVTEKLNVKEFSANKDGKKGSLFENGPVNFTERIANSGNVHEAPTGQIKITDIFGKSIGNLNVNLPPRNILPASTRKFDQTLDKQTLGSRILFGKYHAHLTLTYGAHKTPLTADMTFWVIPYRLIAGIIIGLILAYFILRTLIRRYNARIISQAQGTKSSRTKRK